MDRDELNALLAAMEGDDVGVKPNGNLWDTENNEYAPDDVATALDELEETCGRLRKVLAWARTAPEFGGKAVEVGAAAGK